MSAAYNSKALQIFFFIIRLRAKKGPAPPPPHPPPPPLGILQTYPILKKISSRIF